MVLIAHTIPALYIPSKNKLKIHKVSKNKLDTLPKNIDMKNPTHVDVHNVQLIKSPKNLDLDFIHSLCFSNIEPQTKIDVIPYAINAHNINIINKKLLNIIITKKFYSFLIVAGFIIHHIVNPCHYSSCILPW